MMKIFTNLEIQNLIIDESYINSITWQKNAIDLCIDLDWCGMPEYDLTDKKTFLFFEWVTNFKINMQYKDNQIGLPEITSFNFEQFDNIFKVNIRFDFQPEGEISFRCNNIKFCIE